MKRDVAHLEKYDFVLETQEQKLVRKIADLQKKHEQEKRKFDMLHNCLQETRQNLMSQAQQSVSVVTFQQYQHFIDQIEKALKQQNEVLNQCKMLYDQHLLAFKEIKLKRNKLSELITKIANENNYHANRKENQSNTEIFNRLKPYN